jgi:hypothetical protein
MEKSKLALELKEIEYQNYDELKNESLVACSKSEWFDILYDMSDDKIIDTFNSCHCCGEKMLNPLELAYCIKNSQKAENFIDIINSKRV